LEQHSEHPIATGIVKSAKEKEISFKEITDFESITGKGIQGSIDGKIVNVVSPGYVNDNNLSYDQQQFEQMSEEEITDVFVMIDGKKVKVVSHGYVNDNNLSYDQQQFDQMSEEGKTVVFVLLDDELVGMIALADIVRETAKEAIATLKKNGVHSIMLTGDNKK